VLLVVAHGSDEPAARLIRRWDDRGARLLTPRDLSTAGWQFRVGGVGPGWAVASGERIATDAISGVVTRLPVVREEDLGHIGVEDRPYVATEMTSFLIAWLTSLSCSVLNRPSATSLLGPTFGQEQWIFLAARAAMRLESKPLDQPRPLPTVPVSVIGDRWIGDVDQALGAQSVKLARLAGAELLTVRFDGRDGRAPFVSAEPLVDVARDEIADALLERLERKVAA